MIMPRSASAFSLVELSIVLVILGLMTGGILGGQALIRAAELRSVSTEYQRWITATQTFRDKYFAIPGDMSNATMFWGFQGTAAAPGCVSNSGISAVTSTGTCDGNGNGLPGLSAAAATTGESYQFWRQLASAGLVEGVYSGIAGTIGPFEINAGINVPRSKMNNALWSAYFRGTQGDTRYFSANYGNAFVVGAKNGSDNNNLALFRPEEAWNIDTKMDDGKPGTGKIIGLYWNNLCATAVSNTDYASNYNLASSNPQCVLYFTNAY
ncbi:type II secretion system protein [Sphingomonas sp. 35-24ZXX]|uniref:type II secretion system protein n=1 Tax=Sphingomonas sp. 35-24ZXX TaxID=1545915 RepID=UPI0018CE4A48|nr:prepilin-type N-terminal cleavage/methylation domain-containing protein [Sphingomonas sp. 35-24ZXX]